MATQLRDGELDRIIRTTAKKLVAVDFSNPRCGPCIGIKDWWNSRASAYSGVMFYTIMCDSNPRDSQTYGVKATPTFVFFLDGKEVGRVLGPDKSKITAILEKHKAPASAFTGKGRQLGNSEDVQNAPAPQPQPTLTPRMYCRDILIEMGFPLEKVRAALSAVPNGSVDDCVLFLESVQNNEHSLSEENITRLIQMGFSPEIARAAAERVGPGTIDECLTAIEEISSNENSGASDPQTVPELHEAPVDPSPVGQSIGDSAPAPVKRAEPSTHNELDDVEKRRREDLLEKRKIRERINLNARSRANAAAPELTQRAEVTRPSSSVRSDCVLKLVFEDGQNVIESFRSDDNLEIVRKFIEDNVAGGKNRRIAFESTFPKVLITKERFNETLIDLQMVPRGQLFVKYL
jgi:thioredoxin 1